MTIQILGDLIADVSMRLTAFPIEAQNLHRLSYFAVGPGGACNVAIMAARFGLKVSGLGELGADVMGEVVRDGLQKEGVLVDQMMMDASRSTPVAGVMVDQQGEPGYLGYPGKLALRKLPESWKDAIAKAELLFADGWAETPSIAEMVLEAFTLAKEAGVPVLFDPGPGNPDAEMNENAWMQEAIALSQVVLLNRDEAKRLTNQADDEAMIQRLHSMGPEFVVMKRGKDGLLLYRGDERVDAPGFSVQAIDKTGAGDSVTGAVMYGFQKKLPLDKLAVLANATGAAKVMKLGTGHSMPTMQEIAAVLEANGYKAKEYLPS